jgi:hypothetical protein
LVNGFKRLANRADLQHPRIAKKLSETDKICGAGQPHRTRAPSFKQSCIQAPERHINVLHTEILKVSRQIMTQS